MEILILIGLVCIAVLWRSQSRLKARITRLEHDLASLAQPAGQTETPSAPPPALEPGGVPDPQRATTKSPWLPATRPPSPDSDSDRDTAVAPPRTAAATAAPDASRSTPPRAFVFRAENTGALAAWLRENWVLAVAAVSLALAGVFMVQYGVEHGLLTPFWRVMGALGFGTALIVGGEAIRRRHGDTSGATRHLPSTLTGAGLVVLFAGVLSARVLYDLIGPVQALAGLCAVSALAVVLGWFYGPVLAAVGIVGASAAPFLVGGKSDDPWIFHYYFALVALAGLAVDTVKRWAWVSAVTLIATLSGIWLLHAADADALHFIAASLIIALGSITIPECSLVPHHGGASLLDMLRKRAWPEFPTRLAFGVTAAATAAALVVTTQSANADEAWLGLITLMVLLIATAVWMARAPALHDHAALPGLALLAAIVLQALDRGPLMQQFLAALNTADPEVAPPDTSWIVYTLAALGALGSGLAFWRMVLARRDAAVTPPVIWALSGAVFAPATVLILEFLWDPARVTGAYPWALVVIAIAALMTLLAERTAHGPDHVNRALRTGLFAVAALTLIALAFFLILTKTALTLALAAMVLLVTLLDRKFDLPLLGWFIQLGVAVISYRLIIDPGLDWATATDWKTRAFRVSLFQAVTAYAGPIALMALAWRLTPRDRRGSTRVVLESGLWTLSACFAIVLLFRLIGRDDMDTHWGLGLMATVWLASAFNQIYRLRVPGLPLRWLRYVLAIVFGLISLALLTFLWLGANPLHRGEPVLGPPVLDTLAVAFLSLAAAFGVAAWRLDHLRRFERIALGTLAALHAAAYVGFEIRRIWRGRDLSVPGVTDPELYSYTVALLLGSVLMLVLAFARRSVSLRKLAMAGVALTIAKVFLIDMSGLSGLTRVVSFMGLGLALVGLAWLNRKMTAQWDRGAPVAPEPPEPPGDGTAPGNGP